MLDRLDEVLMCRSPRRPRKGGNYLRGGECGRQFCRGLDAMLVLGVGREGGQNSSGEGNAEVPAQKVP